MGMNLTGYLFWGFSLGDYQNFDSDEDGPPWGDDWEEAVYRRKNGRPSYGD